MPTFAELFKGRDDVHGVYTLPPGARPSLKGKLAGMAATRREPVTPALYEAHLKGEQRLGLVPIRPVTNDVLWIAMDVDEYKSPTLHKKLAAKIAKLALPLVMTRTKSGGAHLWCFFNKPVAADKARGMAADYLKRLGLKPDTEIFPKQNTIREEDDGSWINLPYFGDACKAYDQDGETQLTLEQFLEFAANRTVERDRVGKKEDAPDPATDNGKEAGMPPCIAKMMAEGIEEGGRDSAMTHIGVYLIRAFPDDWEERLADMNQEFCHPALSTYEISKIIKSLKNKDYQYMCKQSPMVGLCNKEVCLTRKFGVGGGEASSGPPVVIDAIEKIDGDEPLYNVTMDDYKSISRKFTVDGETLHTFRTFRVAAMKALNKMLPAVKDTAWALILNEAFQTMVVVQPEHDTQMRDRVISKFKEWTLQTAMGTPNVIVEHGIPYYDGEALLFKPNDFLNMIDKQFRVSRDLVWIFLREWGVTSSKITIADKEVPVWKYTVPDDDMWFSIGKSGAF